MTFTANVQIKIIFSNLISTRHSPAVMLDLGHPVDYKLPGCNLIVTGGTALWHVKEGKTEEFIAAWKRFGKALSQIPDSPPVEGTLIQSLSDPLVFYSFGP